MLELRRNNDVCGTEDIFLVSGRVSGDVIGVESEGIFDEVIIEVLEVEVIGAVIGVSIGRDIALV